MVARFVDTSCGTMICSCSSYNCSIKTVPVKDSESATCSHSKRPSTIPDLNETSIVLTFEQGIVKTSFVVCLRFQNSCAPYLVALIASLHWFAT